MNVNSTMCFVYSTDIGLYEPNKNQRPSTGGENQQWLLPVPTLEGQMTTTTWSLVRVTTQRDGSLSSLPQIHYQTLSRFSDLTIPPLTFPEHLTTG